MEEQILYELSKMLKIALKKDECPIAALIVYNNKIIAKSYNTRNKSNLTIDHAEIKVINKANKKLKSWRLNKCTLYVTLEPCEMCKNVIKESRIDKVYYLLEREPLKKQYNKTVFEVMSCKKNQTENFINNYRKIMKNFWQNKR